MTGWVAPEVTLVDEPFVADERTSLAGWLARQRSSLLAKCASLTAEWAWCDRAVAGHGLDETFVNERWGQMSLRWLFTHLIAEYAGHCGHADLLRERIDGRVEL